VRANLTVGDLVDLPDEPLPDEPLAAVLATLRSDAYRTG